MKFRPWRQGNYERKALSRLDPALGMNYDVDARYIGSEEQGMCPADRRTRNLAIHRSHFRERARIKHTDSRTAINEGRDGGRFGIRAPGPCHWTGVGNGLHVRNGNFLDLVGSKKNISIHRAAATVAACDVLPSGREKEKANQSGEEGGGQKENRNESVIYRSLRARVGGPPGSFTILRGRGTEKRRTSRNGMPKPHG